MILVGSYVKRFQMHIDIPKRSVLTRIFNSSYCLTLLEIGYGLE